MKAAPAAYDVVSFLPTQTSSTRLMVLGSSCALDLGNRHRLRHLRHLRSDRSEKVAGCRSGSAMGSTFFEGGAREGGKAGKGGVSGLATGCASTAFATFAASGWRSSKKWWTEKGGTCHIAVAGAVSTPCYVSTWRTRRARWRSAPRR